MLPAFSKRSGTPLTDNEKLMIINAHNYLSKVNFSEESHLKSTLRKRVAEALGVAEKLLRTKILNSNKTAEQVSTPVLCQFLSENGYTFSKWKLLRASYHKRRVENISTSSTKKQEIVEWLTVHNISFSNELRKPELLELIQMHKEKVSFTCVEIAKQYGHEVFYTPSYYCELQPIEDVWAVVKGEVARSGPHPNLLSIQNTLLDAFKNKINSKVILRLWRKTLKNAKAYFEANENANLIGEESDDYSDTDDDV
ncbi:uncharacterized protein OCT59_002772 [Rhizophagus irregularis]|uniref:uncharacterized protein n=1 Tax=Rhizophagus irregularis TaxID=588596 RepID=UPI000CB73629|nr:hypothetical protein OCT59_002772 [Rhizophagus irregularis]GBC36390.1 uncharacterized protein LOC114348969 isoform X1 [Rhizophagus irregularis DAOM 181602=DAOM 197198]CAG8734294.1 5847_t:CDS:2 [Rhizophagus irregularis]